jgi:hypothetical protein
MKKIYIVTTYTGTALSYLIRNISKTPYAHVSIALNEQLKPMYSFGRLNPKTPLFAGFVEENINEGLYAIKSNTMCRVYSLIVTDLQYDNLYKNIMSVSNNRELYSYDVMALIYLTLNKSREAKYKYVCSHFVADILQKSGICLFEKPSYNVRPNDFFNQKYLTLEYEGLLSQYKVLDSKFLPSVANA